jgi:hypothetical protein
MINNTIIFFRKNWIFISMLALLLLHLPFLTADPPDRVSWSRGPWTDEGIYLSQIRNAINHGTFDINESDCVAKTPLFNLLIYPFFLIFGTKWIVARCFILFSSIGTFLFILYNTRQKISWLFVILLADTQFYLFHYTHFAQAELLQCDFLLLSLFFFTQNTLSELSLKKQVLNVFLSCMFIALAYYTKISSSYLVIIPPACLFMEYILALIFKKENQKERLYKFLFSILFTVLFISIYLLCWYLPHKDTFELLDENYLNSATGFAFSWKDFWVMLPYNYNILIHDPQLYFYFWLALLTFVFLIILSVLKIKKKVRPNYMSPVLFTLIWFLLEVHKFGYHYLPQRYLIFTILSLVSLSGMILRGIISSRYLWFYPLILIFVFIVATNFHFYNNSLQNRHYFIKEMNEYLGRYDLKNETIIGTWSSSATWDCGARSIPIWKDYYYHEDPVNTFHPRIIISEADETDSDSAYSKQNINLKAISDSSRQFNINLWKPVVYWLKK